MRKVWNIAQKDIRVEFAERTSVLFFVILPLLFTAVLGVGMSGISPTESRITVLVVDEDHSFLSRRVQEALQVASSLAPRPLVGETLEEAIAKKKAPLVVIIPQGLEDEILQGREATVRVRRMERSVNALSASAKVRAALTPVVRAAAIARLAVQAAQRVHPFSTPKEREALFRASFDTAYAALQKVPVRVNVEYPPGSEKHEEATGFEQASAGQLVTWSLITFLGVTEALVDERTRGTLRRLLVTPVSRSAVLAGKVLGRLLLGAIQMVILIAAGEWLFGVNWGQSLFALFVAALAFALTSVSLGVALSTVVRDGRQASGVMVLVSLVLAPLGGAWWPLEITPPTYQKVAHLFPSTWAMQAFSAIITRGVGVAEILPEVGVLLLFAVLFFGFGIWRLQWE